MQFQEITLSLNHKLDNAIAFNAYKSVQIKNYNIVGALSRKRRSCTFSNKKFKYFCQSGHKHNYQKKQHTHHIQSNQNNKNRVCKQHTTSHNHRCTQNLQNSHNKEYSYNHLLQHGHSNGNSNVIQQTTTAPITITTVKTGDNNIPRTPTTHFAIKNMVIKYLCKSLTGYSRSTSFLTTGLPPGGYHWGYPQVPGYFFLCTNYKY